MLVFRRTSLEPQNLSRRFDSEQIECRKSEKASLPDAETELKTPVKQRGKQQIQRCVSESRSEEDFVLTIPQKTACSKRPQTETKKRKLDDKETTETPDFAKQLKKRKKYNLPAALRNTAILHTDCLYYVGASEEIQPLDISPVKPKAGADVVAGKAVCLSPVHLSGRETIQCCI